MRLFSAFNRAIRPCQSGRFHYLETINGNRHASCTPGRAAQFPASSAEWTNTTASRRSIPALLGTAARFSRIQGKAALAATPLEQHRTGARCRRPTPPHARQFPRRRSPVAVRTHSVRHPLTRFVATFLRSPPATWRGERPAIPVVIGWRARRRRAAAISKPPGGRSRLRHLPFRRCGRPLDRHQRPDRCPRRR